METLKQYEKRIATMSDEEWRAHREHLASRSIARSMWEDYWSDPWFTLSVVILLVAGVVANLLVA